MLNGYGFVFTSPVSIAIKLLILHHTENPLADACKLKPRHVILKKFDNTTLQINTNRLMEISVATDEIKNILREIKNQFISIAIRNHSGVWSDQYFSILEIKDLHTAGERTLVVVLSSLNNSQCIAIDAKSIHGIRCNKYLNLEGQLASEVSVLSEVTEFALH